MSEQPGTDPNCASWRTMFRQEVRDELRAVPRNLALRIIAKLTELESDPYGFGTTALVGDPTRRRLRVSDYRIVCTLDHGQLIIWIIQATTAQRSMGAD